MMKKLLKKVFSISMLALVLFSYTVSPVPVNAATSKEPETLGDLQKEYEALLQKKKDNDAQKQETKNQIQAKKNAISKAEADIDQAEHDIGEATEKIEESNLKIETLTTATENAMKALQQMKSKNAYLQYIADSASITEFIMRIKAMEQITNSYQSNINDLDNLIKENEQLKIDLKNKQDELEKKIPEYQAAIESLYGNLESYDKFELDIDTQIDLAKKNLDSYKEASMNIYKKINYDAKLVDLMENNFGWLKPLTSGKVTSPEGYRTHPVTGAKYSFHSGIDIGRVSEGTSVYATASGKVSGIVRYSSCGGNMVYVDVVVNGKQYTTYFYHLLSINVSIGQKVTTNTVVGTVGGGAKAKAAALAAGKKTDGCSTGAHLHYGVMTGAYAGSTPVSRVIVPPGFKNAKGYSWTSRTAFYS